LSQVGGAEGSRICIQGSNPCGAGNAYIAARVLADEVTLIVSEKEQAVAKNRTADLPAVTVVVVLRVGNLAARGPGRRVQIAILEILIQAAVQGVGAAEDVGVELTTGRVAKLWRELGGDQRKTAYGIVRYIDQGTRDCLVVVVDALDLKVVVTGTLAANRRADANPDTAGGGDTRAEQRAR
jgi:hypothetical protein